MKLIKTALLLSSFTCLEANAMDHGKGGSMQIQRDLYRLGRNLGLDNPLQHEAQRNRQQMIMNSSNVASQGSQNLQDPLSNFEPLWRSLEPTGPFSADRENQGNGNLDSLSQFAEAQTMQGLERANTVLSHLRTGSHSNESHVPPASSTVEPTFETILTVENYERLMANPNDEALLRQITKASFQSMLSLLRGMNPKEARHNHLIPWDNFKGRGDGLIVRLEGRDDLIVTLERTLENWDATYHPNALRALYYATRSFDPCAAYKNANWERRVPNQGDLKSILNYRLGNGDISVEEARTFCKGEYQNVHNRFIGWHTVDEAKLRQRFPQDFLYSDHEGSCELRSFDAAEWKRYERNNSRASDKSQSYEGLLSDETLNDRPSGLFRQLKVLPVFLPQGISALMVLEAAQHGYRLVNLAAPESLENAYQRHPLRTTVTRQDLLKYQNIASGIKKAPKHKRPALHNSLGLLMASMIDSQSEKDPEYVRGKIDFDLLPTNDWRVSRRYWDTKKNGGQDWTELPIDHWELFSQWADPNKPRL